MIVLKAVSEMADKAVQPKRRRFWGSWTNHLQLELQFALPTDFGLPRHQHRQKWLSLDPALLPWLDERILHCPLEPLLSFTAEKDGDVKTVIDWLFDVLREELLVQGQEDEQIRRVLRAALFHRP